MLQEQVVRRPPYDAQARIAFSACLLLLLTSMWLAGCTVVPAPEPAGPGRPTNLAEPAQWFDAQKSPTSTGPPNASEAPSSGAFRMRMNASDRAGDRAMGAPPYADLVSVVIESDAKDLRVSVSVASNLSAALNAGEVMGIGVDLYRDNRSRESDYQLFAEGSQDGWYAYLQTPDGFVQYPGTFRLGGQHVLFQVPLQSVDGLSARAASTFLDWSERGVVVNAASSDRAPDSGRAMIEP
jgi:hypothetical protein